MGQKISLVNGGKIISDSSSLAEHFKTFFKSAVDNLNLPSNSDILNLDIRGDLSCPIDIINSKYSCHPSILKIRENMAQNPRSFRFHEVDLTSVEKEIGKLNYKKAITFGNILKRDLK